MFIYHSLKLIYILVPKTGTNTFWRSLAKVHKEERVKVKKGDPVYSMEPITLSAHFTARQAKTLIDTDIWAKYKKIGFVRNPYDWILSYYYQGGGLAVLGEPNDLEFGEFLQKFKMTPFYWFLDENGENLMDKIYRTEDLDRILSDYGARMRVVNKTPDSKNKGIVLTDEHKAIIDKRFEREWVYYARV